MSKCPCGSGNKYSDCCEPYINQTMVAPTAESLMRARYTAYTKGAVDFIEKSHSEETRDTLSVEETRKWSKNSIWLGLEIINTTYGKATDDKGSVEFKATYSQKGITHIHHEVSQFEKKDGKWLYKEGKIIPTTLVRTSEKVGRNEPCPCGSGKKYKKCCG